MSVNFTHEPSTFSASCPFSIVLNLVLALLSHAKATEAADTAVVTADDVWLAQFESHAHDGHACDDEEEGQHEKLGVLRHNVTKTNGCKCYEAEVESIEPSQIRLPQR